MNKSQFAEQIAKHHRLAKGTSALVVDMFLQEAARALVIEGELELEGFGTFVVTGNEPNASAREGNIERKVKFYAASMINPLGEPSIDTLSPTELNALLDGL